MHWQRGDYSWESPTDAETRWRWKSSAADSGKALPLLWPDYDLNVDANGRAPKVANYPVSITVGAGEWYQPGRITGAKVWASYDDGATWVEVPVKNNGKKVTATVDNTPATGFVTLKTEVTDAGGKSVTQVLKRFYGIR